MDLKKLMSGIAVVIDDAFKENSSAEKNDSIVQLIKNIEKKWKTPFYRNHEIPSDEVCNNLLQSASFVLLDWRLWESGAQGLEADGIKNNIKFLQKAKDYFIPVFIFTNENLDDIIGKIQPSGLYDQDSPEKNFIFIKRKNDLTGKKLFTVIEGWVSKNASVYTLKAWEQAFYEAKKNLFGSMYEKSPSWPRVFWSSYKKDSADPSSSMVNLINNNMLAYMANDIFEKTVLDKTRRPRDINSEDIKLVLEGASFIPKERLPGSDIRSGDLFKQSGGKYLLNIRPDCDCIPRGEGQGIDDVELYCIKGKHMSKSDIKKSYIDGHFNERISESIIFAVDKNKTVKFQFKELYKERFSEIKKQHIGRITHPYITRVQQRYSSYLQRQGLPRIPEEAVISDDATTP